MTAPFTVLQVIPALRSGGAEAGCLQVARALTAAGHRALVLSEGGRLEEDLAAAGGELIRAPVARRSPLAIYRNAALMARLVREYDVDILHARSRAPAWSAYLAARRTGVAFMTTYHSGYSEQNRLKNLYNSVMVRGRRVIAVSDYMARLIRQRYGTPEERIAVIHRGVDPAVFDPARVDPAGLEALRQGWNIRPRDKVILLAGRLAARKGQAVLIEAAAQLNRQGMDDFVCLLVGDLQGREKYRDAILTAAARQGLAGRVRFTGHRADMAAIYALADVSLCVSENEGFPRVALEAQAMATPVIVSDTGPGREVALTPPDAPPDRATGLRVAYNDAGALAAALADMLAWPEERRRAMGRRGSAFVLGRYTVPVMCARTLKVYRQVIEETRR